MPAGSMSATEREIASKYLTRWEILKRTFLYRREQDTFAVSPAPPGRSHSRPIALRNICTWLTAETRWFGYSITKRDRFSQVLGAPAIIRATSLISTQFQSIQKAI